MSPRERRTIVYYVSGHGYGHVTRSSALIRALLKKKIVDTIFLRTRVSMKVIHELLSDLVSTSNQIRVELCPPDYDLDAGTVQHSPLDLDVLETLKRHAEMYSSMHISEKLRSEAEFLRSLEGNLIGVLSDASPLPLEAAKEAAVPGILVSNFDWSGIYRTYVEHLESLGTHATFLASVRPSLSLATKMYASASLVCRLSGAPPSPVPYEKVVDVGWLCPKILHEDVSSCSIPFETCRRRLEDILFKRDEETMNSDNVGSVRKIILVTFGGQPGQKQNFLVEPRMQKVHGYSLAFIFATPDAERQVEGCCNASLTGRQARAVAFGDEKHGSVAELTKICDIVLCKPGYGTISEAVGSCTTVVYVKREPEFIEERYLVKPLGCGAVRLDRSAFEMKKWSEAIRDVLRHDAVEAVQKVNKDALNGTDTLCNVLGGFFKIIS